MALDAVAVEVVRDLRRHGIEPILLKGRSLAERLRPERTYRDVDLLVAPADHATAGRALVRLGFIDVMTGARGYERPPHADTFVRRADGAVVDLHRTLLGVSAAPDVVWSALGAQTRPLAVGVETVTALDDVGMALQVALHAARDGRRATGPMADLACAVATFDRSTMDGAAALAGRIGALPDFRAGLALLGADRSPGPPTPIPAATVVRAAGSGARGVGSLALVLAAPWWRRPLTVAGRAFPSRVVLRRSMPLARRGRLGLAAAYTVRPLWMAARLPAVVRSWRAAARSWPPR